MFAEAMAKAVWTVPGFRSVQPDMISVIVATWMQLLRAKRTAQAYGEGKQRWIRAVSVEVMALDVLVVMVSRIAARSKMLVESVEEMVRLVLTALESRMVLPKKTGVELVMQNRKMTV